MTPRALALLALASFSGCAASGGAVGSALVNTAVAGAVSGVRRSRGDCYTPCSPGSTCDRATGLCEPVPCGGRCGFDQRCEVTAVGEQCVPARPVPAP